MIQTQTRSHSSVLTTFLENGYTVPLSLYQNLHRTQTRQSESQI